MKEGKYLYPLNKAIVLSLLFHLLIALFIAQQFSQKKSLPISNKVSKSKPIQAKLYFPPQNKQITDLPLKIKPEDIKAIIVVDKVKADNSIIHQEKPLTKKKVTKVNDGKSKPEKISKQGLTSTTSTKNIGQNSFEKLQSKLTKQNFQQAQNNSFNKYLANKNTIARSSTKFNEVPKAQIQTKEVDCNNSVLNTTITAISGLLGGGVRCNRMPNLKNF